MTQSVLLEDELALEVLRVGLHGVGLNCLLLPGGSLQLRTQLGHLLVALNIGHLAYGPSSLRPGGALHLYTTRGCSLADLMYRGRWDCPRTLSHYLQEGFAALALTYVGEAAAGRIRQLAQLLPELLAERAAALGLGPAERSHCGGHVVQSGEHIAWRGSLAEPSAFAVGPSGPQSRGGPNGLGPAERLTRGEAPLTGDALGQASQYQWEQRRRHALTSNCRWQ